MKLDIDMFTIIDNPHPIGVKSIYNSKNSFFVGHEFFEASSLRKINDKYYFIYSSILGHELCYALSLYPDKDFVYGGTIVSIGDIGLNGINNVKDALNMVGNTHGSILSINDKHYIFYHRQTNQNCFSRQACAEEIKILPNGKINQVEVTSCGLNNGLLLGKGEYSSRIACNLICKKGGKFYNAFKSNNRPYFTQENNIQFIKNITNGTNIVFKYFYFENIKEIMINVKCSSKGMFYVYDENNLVAKINVDKSNNDFKNEINISSGKHLLRFVYQGKGKVSFYKFNLL